MARSSRRFVLLSVGALLGCVVYAPQPARADEPPKGEESQAIVDDILAKWKSYRDEMQSVRYEASGSATIPKELNKGQDHRHDVSGTWLINFVTGEYRVDKDDQSFDAREGLFRPDREIYSYVAGELRQHNVSVTLHRGKLFGEGEPEFYYRRRFSTPFWNLWNLPPLVAHGYVPRALIVDSDENQIGATERDEVDLHETALLDGQECHVLRSRTPREPGEPLLELWVEDTERRLVRRVRIMTVHSPGARFVGAEVDLWYDVRDGRAALQRWRCVNNFPGLPERPMKTMEMTVTAFVPDPPLTSDRLQLRPEPGMLVFNERTQNGYFQPAPGAHAPLAEVLSQMQYARLGLILAAGAVVVVFGFDQFRSRMRKKKAAPAAKAGRWRPRASFAVKTLLLFVALCAIALGYVRATVTEQTRLVTELKKRGAYVITVAAKEPGWGAALREFVSGEPTSDVIFLGLQSTNFTDDDLIVLARLPRLKELGVGEHFTGEGLVHLKGNKTVTSLGLANCRVSDEGLKAIGELHNLRGLWLDGTAVTDSGMAHLRGLSNLNYLSVRDTAVTAEGLRTVFGDTARRISLGVDKEEYEKVKRLYPKADVYLQE
ncbi:MAG: hypothetical protein HYS13_04390 [Planctomycetia bacterium]|nr:hypothetical protein [Planctomycetia bacterium]